MPQTCPYCGDTHMRVEECPFRTLMEGPTPSASSWDYLESAEPVAIAETAPDEPRWMPLGVAQVWEGDQA